MINATRILGLAVLLLAAPALPAGAADPIRIGVIYPLTGNAASAGASARDAVELGVELINNVHAELKGMPLSGSAGLPRLGNAKIELVVADHQGNPSVGQSQTLRLITQEKVVAMLGAYHSSVAMTATAVAERQGVPFLVADSVAPAITGRGFKWVFRTGPVASDFAIAYTQFLNQMKQSGKKIDSIYIVNENTEYGTSVSASIIEVAKTAGLNIVGQIPYNANSADVSAQVLQLKDKRPDVVIFISYTSDTILYFKTMKSLDYMPPMIIGDDAGFSDPAFIPSVGELAQAVMNRSAWDIGKPGSNTHRINELFRAKTGRDLDDTSARFLQGFLVLCEAINRAGSTEPAKIQQALQKTELRPEQLIIGYRGVRFDETGQNVEAATYLIQLQGKEYKAVWPAQRATAPLIWPMTGWKN
jgi:branched-chain amino acid transport system substrate-binding protein